MNIRTCKHCKQQFDISKKPKGWLANHSRWCDLNPKRADYINTLDKTRGLRVNFENQYTKARKEGRKVPTNPRKGKTGFKGTPHSEETKQLMREKALASPHRRLKKGTVNYKGVLLDSSWELELAKRLDELGVVWSRPDPLPWLDEEGVAHNYFPDFYLPEYNLYLDPKNPHALRVQKKKIEKLLTQYDNIVIINSLEECRKYTPNKGL